MSSKQIERKEVLKRDEFGIYSEIDKLRRAVTWGPAGIEAGLTHFLPDNISLFLEHMDVLRARRQYEDFELTLRENGVEVIRMRDEIARSLSESDEKPMSRDIETLKEAILKKAKELRKKYGMGDFDELRMIVDRVIADDLERYRESRVVLLLNEKLTNVYVDELPMANDMFARDQQNVVADTVVWSRMKHLIRRPEVDLFIHYGGRVFDGRKNLVIEGNGAYFEGGDLMIFDNKCLVGVGGRTSLEGVIQLSGIATDHGLEVYAVLHPDRDSGNLEHQTTMHLDTFMMRGPKNTVVVLEEEARARKMVRIFDEMFGVEKEVQGSLWEMLTNDRYDIITISREEQLGYASNFLVIDENTVLITIGCNGTGHQRLAKEFENRGVRVILQDMTAITHGYGGAHCSIAPIYRAN